MRFACLLVLAFLPGCVAYDLAGAPSKDLGVGHLYERLPATAKVAQFRSPREGPATDQRLLMRCTDAFTTSLKRTDIFERVLQGTGDPADIGFEGVVTRCECRQNYAFVWAFYSFFAVIAVPANLPLSIDDADYELTVRAIHLASGQTLGTYRASVHLHSWRGAWSLFETFLSDPGQVYDLADRQLLEQIVDDYPKMRGVVVSAATAKEAPR